MITALLLDIEGTTTPIDFVYQTLFPYARMHMAEFLATNFTAEDEVLLTDEYAAETSAAKPLWTDPPTAYLLWLMDQDRKSRGLKTVQGRIWAQGYADGTIRSQAFPDVAPALRRWKELGRKVYIYSSGSVQAQKLLFGYTADGDLTPLLDGYFDTEIGAKKEVASYRAIAERVGLAPGDMLFVSDIAAELMAAHEAGLQTVLAVRPGNQPQDGNFERIRSFDELTERIAGQSKTSTPREARKAV